MPEHRIEAARSPFLYRELAIPTFVCAVFLLVLFPYVFRYGHVISPGYMLFERPPWSFYESGNSFPHAKYEPAFEYYLTWIPWYKIAAESWDLGQWPLWNPYQLTGTPLLANSQSAFFYPPHILFALMNVHIAGTINILLKLWLSGLTAYYCARSLAMTIQLSLFVSISWMLAPLRLFWVFWSPADTTIWLPLQFLGVELLLANRQMRGFALIGISGALLLLAGHPETALAMALPTGAYFLLRLLVSHFRTPAYAVRLASIALLAWVGALLLASAQILPFLEYLLNSSTLTERAAIELGPVQIRDAAICLWLPRFYGVSDAANSFWGSSLGNSNWTAMYYPGIVVWLGIAILITSLLSRQRGAYWCSRCSCLAICVAVCLLLAFGADYGTIVSKIPLMHVVLRAWFFPFALFGLIILSARALQIWFSEKRRPIEAAPAVLVLSLGLCLTTIHYLGLRNGQLPSTIKYVDSQFFLLLVFTLGIVAALFLNCIHRARSSAFWGLLLLCSADLLRAGGGIHPTCPRQILEKTPKLIDYLKARYDSGRVLALEKGMFRPAIYRGLLQNYGVEDLLGHEGLYPMRLQRFYSNCDLFGNMSSVFSIRYMLKIAKDKEEIPPELANSVFAKEPIDGFAIWENTAAWPRVKLIGAARVVPDVNIMFRIMNGKGFDPAKVALLESPPPLQLPESSTTDPGTVQVVTRTPNVVVVEADVKERAVLVLTDQYFPGWKAEVDGVSSEVFAVYSLFRGLVVEPGAHTIVFRYDPLSFRIGLFVSTLTLLTGAGFAINQLRRRQTDPV